MVTITTETVTMETVCKPPTNKHFVKLRITMKMISTMQNNLNVA